MKLNALTCSSLFLSILVSGTAQANDPAPANAERLLNGGLGYDFSLTYEEAQNRGPSPLPDQSIQGEELSTIVGEGFFPMHTLTYTVATRKLYKIAGVRGYGAKAGNAMSACFADFASVKEGLASKYPDLKPAGSNTVCERAPSHSYGKPRATDTSGGRCIKLQCLGDANQAFLQIEYVDRDLLPVALTERAERKRQIQEQAMRDRGFDPSKL